MKKITKRNMYEALVNFAREGSLTFETEDGVMAVSAEELEVFAENEIALLDKKASKAKERAATKKAEGDELTVAVRAAMSSEVFESIADITNRIEGEDITVGRVQYRLNVLVKNGEAVKEQITVPATENQKARKLVGYKLV